MSWSSAPRSRRSPAALLALLLLVVVALAGCSGSSSDDGGAAATDGTTSSTGASPADDPDPADGVDAPRIVALGEERVLADLLALGIRPVASTANVIVDGGFVGLDEFDTDGIEPLPSTERNMELLASFQPEVLVVNEFVLGELGRDVLEALADEIVVVPDGDAATQVTALGDAFDRRAEADALVTELEAARDEGRGTLAPLPESERVISVLTIYSGPTLAAWFDGPVAVPATLIDLGFTLRPDAVAVAGAPSGPTGGRAYLSEEEIGLFDAPTIVMLQSEHVEGEADAIETISASALWQLLPAVEADRTITVDRLGYPGIAGQIRLVEDLVRELGG